MADNNTSTTSTTIDPNLLVIKKNFFLTYYAAILVTTVAGNTLVCLAIYLDRRLRSSTNSFVANLAVADLLYALVGLPFRIAQTSGTVFELHECYIWIWVDMVCASASIANLALISIDRYLKITKPFQYHSLLTQTRAAIAVASVWLYSGVLASLSLVSWAGQTGGVILQNGQTCLNINQVFYTVAMIVAFILPLVILVMNYAKVYVEALKQFNKMVETTVNHSKEEKTRHNSIIKDFKATKTLAVVIGTFTICWCPFFILFAIAQYNMTFLLNIAYPWNEIIISLFFWVLPNLNSALNPLIYAYFNNDFRRAFKTIMTRLVGKPSMSSRIEVSGEDLGGRRSSILAYFLQSKLGRLGRHSQNNSSLFQNHNINSSNV